MMNYSNAAITSDMMGDRKGMMENRKRRSMWRQLRDVQQEDHPIKNLKEMIKQSIAAAVDEESNSCEGEINLESYFLSTEPTKARNSNNKHLGGRGRRQKNESSSSASVGTVTTAQSTILSASTKPTSRSRSATPPPVVTRRKQEKLRRRRRCKSDGSALANASDHSSGTAPIALVRKSSSSQKKRARKIRRRNVSPGPMASTSCHSRRSTSSRLTRSTSSHSRRSTSSHRRSASNHSRRSTSSQRKPPAAEDHQRQVREWQLGSPSHHSSISTAKKKQQRTIEELEKTKRMRERQLLGASSHHSSISMKTKKKAAQKKVGEEEEETPTRSNRTSDLDQRNNSLKLAEQEQALATSAREEENVSLGECLDRNSGSRAARYARTSSDRLMDDLKELQKENCALVDYLKAGKALVEKKLEEKEEECRSLQDELRRIRRQTKQRQRLRREEDENSICSFF